MTLFFTASSSLDLRTYSNVDWAGGPTTRRSIQDSAFFLRILLFLGEPRSKMVSKSSSKAEYWAISTSTSKIVWPCNLPVDMDVQFFTPTSLYCDNQSATNITNNLVIHKRTKYIIVDYHFVKKHYLAHTVALP